MIELFKGRLGELDSFEKLALEFYERFGYRMLSRVDARDLDQVAVEVALLACRYMKETVCNFEIVPVHQKTEYKRFSYAPGYVDTQVKTRAGRVYFVGFGYGS